jgi:hypothetical protein
MTNRITLCGAPAAQASSAEPCVDLRNPEAVQSANLPISMNKILSLVLLAGGVLLLVYGFKASNSISSDFSRLFSGSPTDRSIWMLIGGAVAAALGAGGLLRGAKAS